MKNFIKIIIVIFCLVLVFGGVIIALRKTNDAKYGEDDPNTPKYLTDVTNVSYYPTKIAGVSVTYVDEGTMEGFHLVPDQKNMRELWFAMADLKGVLTLEKLSV